ncbi:flagellar biosynthetic protein FliR [Helicobacter mustelae]|uniref:Flagellar biosynthetic protein FliR n=1 Tax=Helicobacter mustelae (strain ATCC 43772 / CCUG 25715 / CIP 103759 / LMG 18044 / NCTC 12198 / R85-136P) TaxID=679897 RepID=D3UJA2_HELM1|nr:flagellar biosynthetic protein FliR [Helicobacter mustelae]CBG40577.1 flagellar biosynthetic protein [Helicobacter mustelae 12198]SQH72074.1 flagellar biosynthetic protein [Helicobacter mustelae]STP13218.1 flagellar biosynthetic protein [Helicobacter mustelae]
MEFLSLLTQNNTEAFLLLLLRFGGIFAFFPFFDSGLIPVSLRGALAFFMCLVFFPILPHTPLQLDTVSFLIAGSLELLFGFLASLVLQIIFSTLAFAGDSISFSMGLTMASAYDPATGSQKPIVGQVLMMLAMLIALQSDFHHVIFSFVAQSLEQIPLGHFVTKQNILETIIYDFSLLFSVGFAMAFPILGLILLSDIVFGMIMKTHPQFNLLAIGFPVKIALAFIAIIVIIPSIMNVFSTHLKNGFMMLQKIF